MPTRRDVLAGITTVAFTPTVGWAGVGNPIVVSAAKNPDGTFELVGLDAEGDITFRAPLPARGHAAAAHPNIAEIVAIARRPGTFAKVIDCASGFVRQTLAAPEGHHFYGHGAFSSDGKFLYTTENAYTSGAGRIGVWDRSLNYRRVGEFASGGIGPHEILRLPTGNLAVANGGIRTHPETGRDKLNLDTMRSNLSILSPLGVMLDQADVSSDTHHNSLRHIAVQTDGTVACGLQWQGDPFDAPSLVHRYRGDGALVPAEMNDEILRRLDGYIGSVSAFQSDGFAATSPRGGLALTFTNDGRLEHVHTGLDLCGLTSHPNSDCIVTDGNGQVHMLQSTVLACRKRHSLAFDNHLVPIKMGNSRS